MNVPAPDLFEAEGLQPQAWSQMAGYEYGEHSHGYTKVLVCSSGAITFHMADGAVALGPGDRLDTPAGTFHAATVGPDGVTCWEAPVA